MSRLTKKVFTAGMTALADRFNKELSPLVQGIYAEVLADLTVDEFEAGVKRAVTELEFYPTAQQIRSFARPSVPPEVAAGHVFALVTGDPEVRRYEPTVGTIYDLAKIRERHGEAAALAFISIGGGARVRSTPEEKMEWVLKEFREAYVGFATELASRASLERLGVGRALAIGAGRPTEDARRVTSGPQSVGQLLRDVPLVGQDLAAGGDR